MNKQQILKSVNRLLANEIQSRKELKEEKELNEDAIRVIKSLSDLSEKIVSERYDPLFEQLVLKIINLN